MEKIYEYLSNNQEIQNNVIFDEYSNVCKGYNWFVRNQSGIFRLIKNSKIHDHIKKYIDEIEVINPNLKKNNSVRIINLMELCLCLSNKNIGRIFLNTLHNKHKFLFCFNNGVFDLLEMRFRNILPNEFVYYTTGYNYREVLDLENKKEQMMEILESFVDKQTIHRLLKSIALFLKFRNRTIVIKGGACSGKSTFLQLIKCVFGKLSCFIQYLDSYEHYYVLNFLSIEQNNQRLIRNGNRKETLSNFIITINPKTTTKLSIDISKYPSFTFNNSFIIRNDMSQKIDKLLSSLDEYECEVDERILVMFHILIDYL